MTTATCDHDGCTCEAGEEGFCGDYCRDHVGDDHEPHACTCGHPGCGE